MLKGGVYAQFSKPRWTKKKSVVMIMSKESKTAH